MEDSKHSESIVNENDGSTTKSLSTNIENCIQRVKESKKKYKRRKNHQRKSKKSKLAAKKLCSKYAESDPEESTSTDSSDSEYRKFSKKSLKDIIFDTINEKKSKYDDPDSRRHGNEEILNTDASLDAIDMQQTDSQPTQCIDAPQLKLDANGNIVIDEESLIIRSIAPDKLKSSSKAIDITNEVTHETPLLYNSKKTRSTSKSKWSIEDTIRFYQVLSVVGADFQTMSSFFPGKSRDCLKKKFKSEEKLHLDLVDRALSKSLSTENEYLFQKIVDSEKGPTLN